MSNNYSQLLLNCVDTVKEAGQIVLQNWHKPHDVRHKGVIDLVTETDFAVENFLQDKLKKILPAADFVGEESFKISQKIPDLCWIVDPVDGTTNFVHHIPMVGVSVALCSKGKPCLGVIDAPMLGECFYAAINNGAFVNGKPINVSEANKMEDCLIATGFPYNAADSLKQIMERLKNILPASQGLRRLGAASIDMAYVGCGRLDAFYEDGLKAWDMAAGWLIVEESGGKVSNLNGAPLELGDPLLASNGKIHDQLLHLLTD